MQRKMVKRLIVWAIILAALAAFVIFVGIPLFKEEPEDTGEKPVVAYYEGKADPVVMENDRLKFELDPETTQFKLTEKESGREWLSNPADAAQDPIAKGTNKDLLQATLLVTYATSSGTIDMDNYKYSIEDKLFTIDRLEDGSVKVNYTVGKVEKKYIIPTAITVDRYKAFLEAMGSKNELKVKSYYTLYEPDKLDSKKNKDEIIANYPEVLNQALYILKSDTSETNKKKIEGYFSEGGYTQEDYELDQQLVAGAKASTAPVFNVSVIYRLEDGDFVVEIPYSEIRYTAEYRITNVTPLPMFGAAGPEDEGYMLLPEGGGAIIRYNNGKLNQNSYYANLYGWDYASDRKEASSETDAIFPVFGMTRGDGSFICILEGATSYAQVYGDIAGRTHSYNRAYAKYRVLHNDRYNISAKTEQLVYMYEKKIPDDTVRQRYRFVNSTDYVDMARAYSDYLQDRYPELVMGAASETAPVSVELVGAIDKTVVRFGLPLETVVATTTFEQAQTILDDLLASGVESLNLRFSGWCNGGVTQKVLSRVKVENVLGGDAGMQALIAAAKEKGVPLYFDGITCFAYDSGILDGFISFRDAARLTTREQCKLYPFDEIIYTPQDWKDPYYLVKPEYAQEKASNLISALSDKGATGVSFRDIGKLLSGNYHPDETVTREQVLKMNLDTIQEAHDADLSVMIKRGNDYALPYADIVTDMNLDGYPYSIFDAQVPFYQIAIHGMKDYTGEPLNISGDYVTELLRCAEYGAGLNFTFFSDSARIVQDSYHTGFYGAGYDEWSDKAIEMINQYQQDMAGLNNQPIVGHQALAKDVTVTRYEDGTEVYVNYGSLPYTGDGVTVPAMSYCVKGGSQQ